MPGFITENVRNACPERCELREKLLIRKIYSFSVIPNPEKMSDAEKDDWDEDSPWMKEEGGRYEDTTEGFTVEPARSSRSTCRRCRNKIEKVV